MRTDGQTDKYNEANSCFSQFCEKRLKTQLSETWQRQDIFIFKFPGAHIQPFNKCIPKDLPPGVKRPVREIAKLKNEWGCTSTPLHPYMACTRSNLTTPCPKITVQYYNTAQPIVI